MNYFKKSVISLCLMVALTSSSAMARRHVDIVYVVDPLGFSTVLCLLGEAVGCGMLTLLGAVVTTTVALDNDHYKSNAIVMAKGDAKDYLLGGEMTPSLQEAMQAIVDAAENTNHPEIANLSNEDLAAQVYIFNAPVGAL